MDTGEEHGFTIERSVEVEAAPEVVYALVSSIERVGELSPECVGAEWVAGEPEAVGSRFVGHNRVGTSTWSMTCEVRVADPPRCFSWWVVSEAIDPETSVWTYEIEPTDVGARVVERFSMKQPPTGLQASLERHDAADRAQLLAWRRARLTAGIEQTLARVKSIVEAHG